MFRYLAYICLKNIDIIDFSPLSSFKSMQRDKILFTGMLTYILQFLIRSDLTPEVDVEEYSDLIKVAKNINALQVRGL